MRLTQPIYALASVLTALDNAMCPQEAQVLGDAWPGQFQIIQQRLYILFVARKLADNSYSIRMSHHPQESGKFPGFAL